MALKAPSLPLMRGLRSFANLIPKDCTMSTVTFGSIDLLQLDLRKRRFLFLETTTPQLS